MQKSVDTLKANEELGVKYMREWEEKALAKHEGREETLARVNKLTNLLLEDNRLEELKLASKDRDLQEKLFKEYGI